MANPPEIEKDQVTPTFEKVTQISIYYYEQPSGPDDWKINLLTDKREDDQKTIDTTDLSITGRSFPKLNSLINTLNYAKSGSSTIYVRVGQNTNGSPTFEFTDNPGKEKVWEKP